MLKKEKLFNVFVKKKKEGMNDLAFISVGYSDREDALADFRSHEQ